jgi:hypothetical protein
VLYQVVCYKTELINKYFPACFVFNEMEEVVSLFAAMSVCEVVLLSLDVCTSESVCGRLECPFPLLLLTLMIVSEISLQRMRKE